MKIIMDFRKFDGVIGGVERAVLEIARHLATGGHSLVILPKASRAEEVRAELADVPRIEYVPLPVRSHVMSLQNAWLDGTLIQAIAARAAADVIHFPYNWSFPFRKSVPTVLTVHDVIPLTHREAMGWLKNRLVYRPAMRLACRLNDVVATVSHFSADDISRRLGVPRAKIRVIANGIRQPHRPSPDLEAGLVRRFKLERGFVLYVGGIHERKNVPRLIEAFAQHVQASQFAGRLLITGRVAGAPYQERMKEVCDAAVRAVRLEDRVTFTGFISDQELDVLMRRASCLVYPSLYEGFGIPVLEAMRAGTPVVTSATTALPEVAGHAAVLVDPEDVEAIAAGMRCLAGEADLRRDLVRAGKRRAASFTWEKTAAAYLDLYREAVRQRGRQPSQAGRRSEPPGVDPGACRDAGDGARG